MKCSSPISSALRVCVPLVVLAMAALPVHAAGPTSAPSVYQPVCDTSISRWFPDANYSGDASLTVRQGDVATALLTFDLSELPKGTRVRSATLRVYVYDRTNEGHLNIGVHQVLRPWACDQVTWEEASEGVPWAEAGVNDMTTDRAHWVEDALWLEESGRWYAFDVTHLVGAWVMGRDANQGLVLKAESGVSVAYSLGSSEHADSALAPQLLVDTGGFPTITPTYTPTSTPTVTPTPNVTPTPEQTPTEEPASLYYLPLLYR